MKRSVHTVVIGGGQAGLTVGHALQDAGIDYVILDAAERVGDAWRNRWDSLRLFTQAFMNGLPGMPFPAPKNQFVGKDEIADYLEAYAKQMELNVESGARVTRLGRADGGFIAETADGSVVANSVIVAMADYQIPRVPVFAGDLAPDITQLHSTQYRNPGQLRSGTTLVVGLGNSGADIALDVSSSHETIVAGKEAGAIPFALEGWFGRHLGTRLVRFAMTKVLSTSTPIGRKVRKKGPRPPLVRVRPKELAKAGVARVGRITGVERGLPVAEDGSVLEVANVIWCTGYEPGFDWIDLPVFDESGAPRHARGVVDELPGLYFVGLFFLHSLWSETVTGMQRDARHVVDHLVSHRL